MKYEVQLSHVVKSWAIIQVDAANPQEAKRLALKWARDPITDVDWCDSSAPSRLKVESIIWDSEGKTIYDP